VSIVLEILCVFCTSSYNEFMDMIISIIASITTLYVLSFLIFAILLEEVNYSYTSKGMIPGYLIRKLSRYAMSPIRYLVNLFLFYFLTQYFNSFEFSSLQNIMIFILIIALIPVRNLTTYKLNRRREIREQ
jgi:hypothetical protein